MIYYAYDVVYEVRRQIIASEKLTVETMRSALLPLEELLPGDEKVLTACRYIKPIDTDIQEVPEGQALVIPPLVLR